MSSSEVRYRSYEPEAGPRRKFDSGDLMELLEVFGLVLLIAMVAVSGVYG